MSCATLVTKQMTPFCILPCFLSCAIHNIADPGSLLGRCDISVNLVMSQPDRTTEDITH